MSARRQGFTLVEMLIVALLGAVVMGAVYQTLTVEYRSNRQINAVVATQQTIRTSVQMLQADLREVSAKAGDITYANGDSIRFRAMRKIGFVCAHPPSDAVHLDFFIMAGDNLTATDSVIVQASRDTTTVTDDTYYVGLVSPTGSSGSCTVPSTGPLSHMSVVAQRIAFSWAGAAPGSLAEIDNGDMLRSFDTITYGLTLKNGNYVLGRQVNTDTMVTLIGPLAPPASGGLSLTYYDTLNAVIPAANLSSSLGKIGRIQVKVAGRTAGAPGPGGTYTDTLVSDVFLRGN